jgi:8-oxo-dGTP pyrophosphatase MutT (NUDIX family)
MPRVVTCLLENNGEILILRRSERVGTYRGLWSGVSGYVEEDEDPFETAVKEIREEVGVELDRLRLIKRGDPVEFTDFYEGKRYDWVVYPFLFSVEDRGMVCLDWENVEYRWIMPRDILRYDTVPRLKEIVFSMLL